MVEATYCSVLGSRGVGVRCRPWGWTGFCSWLLPFWVLVRVSSVGRGGGQVEGGGFDVRWGAGGLLVFERVGLVSCVGGSLLLSGAKFSRAGGQVLPWWFFGGSIWALLFERVGMFFFCLNFLFYSHV